ncbi:MAG: hypothetical protein SOW44_05335, partial [Porphyromonas sp.]|nr:hypothetical protein [Bacteroidales bacterium]MDY3100746.1 hypothetical protein [Porphyromonas sp.]
ASFIPLGIIDHRHLPIYTPRLTAFPPNAPGHHSKINRQLTALVPFVFVRHPSAITPNTNKNKDLHQ